MDAALAVSVVGNRRDPKLYASICHCGILLIAHYGIARSTATALRRKVQCGGQDDAGRRRSGDAGLRLGAASTLVPLARCQWEAGVRPVWKLAAGDLASPLVKGRAPGT